MEESWSGSGSGSLLVPPLALPPAGLAPPGVGRQPAALHRLRRAGVHLPGQEAGLRGAAHHHGRLLGALRDLGEAGPGPPYIESHQHVCTYNETRLVTVKLPNCQPNVDPTYTYPVALRCDCGVCLTSTTECITSV